MDLINMILVAFTVKGSKGLGKVEIFSTRYSLKVDGKWNFLHRR